MAKKRKDAARVSESGEPLQDKKTDLLMAIGGTSDSGWNTLIANQTTRSLWSNEPDGPSMEQIGSALAGLINVKPKDSIEAMMAAQLIGAHMAAMECHRRAMHPEQSFECRRENLNQANKLSRTFTILVDALNKHRGKGQQKITVEHVTVNEGGQAIVGNVETRGSRANGKT